MAVVAMFLILASFAIPTYQNITLRAREAVLRDDLFTMRSMIDRFALDNKRPPASLEELAEKGYVGDVPVDSITRSKETWQVDTEDFPLASGESVGGGGDVHSGSEPKRSTTNLRNQKCWSMLPTGRPVDRGSRR